MKLTLSQNKTSVLVVLPLGAKPIGYKWIFKWKLNRDDSLDKYKARLVSKVLFKKKMLIALILLHLLLEFLFMFSSY